MKNLFQKLKAPRTTAVSFFLLFVCFSYVSRAHETMSRKYGQMTRIDMLEQQLRGRGIKDPRVLDAMGKVSREFFVPLQLREEAYSDNALPIGYGQTISQPYVVALMTELLEVQETDRVLEIGTGSGYQAAILAELAREVYTIEIVAELYEQTRKRLRELGYQSIYCQLGDGWKGLPEFAPFDKIIVTAAAPVIPEALIEQLKNGGKIVIPVGESGKVQQLKIGVKKHGILETMDTIAVRFVPFVKKND